MLRALRCADLYLRQIKMLWSEFIKQATKTMLWLWKWLINTLILTSKPTAMTKKKYMPITAKSTQLFSPLSMMRLSRYNCCEHTQIQTSDTTTTQCSRRRMIFSSFFFFLAHTQIYKFTCVIHDTEHAQGLTTVSEIDSLRQAIHL